MQLRKYQQSFTYEVRKALAKHKRIIAQSPTGSGKTKMFIYLAKKAQEAGKAVLIIIDSIDIYEQLQAEFPCEQINAGNRFNLIQAGKRYIAMAQTLKMREATLRQFQSLFDNLFIICDEAHVGQATKILEALPNALLAGFTATPAYQWAKHLPKLYNNLVEGPQVSELINDPDGPFLMPYKHFGRKRIDASPLQQKHGEFTEDSQMKVFDVQNVYDILKEDLSTFQYNKAMIFCSSIEHAEHTAKHIPNCIVVHSKKTVDENRCAIQLFKIGRIKICINVAKLTKGFDFPAVDFIILLRATTSLPLYLQMLGRGSRPNEAKEFFTCLDYGGNFERFGFYTDDRNWSELWKAKPKKQGVTPTKLCPKCEYICHAAAPSCPDCGYIFPVKEKEQEAAKTELVELTPQHKSWATMTAIELYQASKERNYKRAIQEARKRESTHPGFLGEFANAAGYKLSWVQDQLRFI